MNKAEKIAERAMAFGMITAIWSGIILVVTTFPDSPIRSISVAYVAAVPFTLAMGTCFTALTIMMLSIGFDRR